MGTRGSSCTWNLASSFLGNQRYQTTNLPVTRLLPLADPFHRTFIWILDGFSSLNNLDWMPTGFWSRANPKGRVGRYPSLVYVATWVWGLPSCLPQVLCKLPSLLTATLTAWGGVRIEEEERVCRKRRWSEIRGH